MLRNRYEQDYAAEDGRQRDPAPISTLHEEQSVTTHTPEHLSILEEYDPFRS